ncbi:MULTISPECIES: isoamylase early set domain-containing protein [Corallincola]|uniref:1,4-alpha-glucan branching protein n=3 Tax=Corallincola TaxID=1775176 RepID=A0A368N6T1_9GAMM|nr:MULTISPECIES: isoamylase early set domain-containing protein [Corallincola]RCU45733.1 1,4-alpha-glucan branching protein [Corallincola holothuriorum]TAA41850.1 1,4-alpha-glucan branching protein [Corallincola spongiicola]TCI02152.1 1,4-alpha-glucan branching protein [Corallincola luteus]
MSVKKQFLKSKPVVKVTFEVSKEAAQDAKDVYLLCEHNGWQREPMKGLKAGHFKATVNLPTDEKADYEYRFCLVKEDGTEVFDNDWEAESYRPSPMGGDNSVISVSE